MTEKTNGDGEYGPDPVTMTNASIAIGLILDGKEPNTYFAPQMLGWYGDCYEEMLQAYGRDGREAARLVFVTWAEVDPAIAALRLNDPLIRKRSWTVGELYTTEFPEPTYTIPGLLPTGLAALGARPKIGKSWMALQISTAVGTGGTVFNLTVDCGKVLYLALEDSPRRMKNRLQKQLAPAEANIQFAFEWQTLIGSGTADLITEIDRCGYTLVVIDTLARALGNIDPNKQAEMGMHLGVLQRVATDRNMTILLIDHHRKSHGGDGDVVDDMLGATSKTGVQDVILGLYRERGAKNAKLKVTGRDIEERELAMRFDRETGLWQCLGDADAVNDSERKRNMIDMIRELGAPSNSELADATDQNRGNCHKFLKRLIASGEVVEVDGRPARYILANEEGRPSDPPETGENTENK